MALDDPEARGIWSVATVMARALEQARQDAGLSDYWGLDLRNVRVPDGTKFFEQWAAPIVRESLQRIAKIHENIGPRPQCPPERSITHDQIFETIGRENDGLFPHTNL